VAGVALCCMIQRASAQERKAFLSFCLHSKLDVSVYCAQPVVEALHLHSSEESDHIHVTHILNPADRFMQCLVECHLIKFIHEEGPPSCAANRFVKVAGCSRRVAGCSLQMLT
jgi:hypothetical protein